MDKRAFETIDDVLLYIKSKPVSESKARIKRILINDAFDVYFDKYKAQAEAEFKKTWLDYPLTINLFKKPISFIPAHLVSMLSVILFAVIIILVI